MSLLFEYGKPHEIGDRETLEQSLIELWRQKSFLSPDTEDESKSQDSQPFVSFDGNTLRAKNYVGFIQNGAEVIEIFPKVFKNLPDPATLKGLMLRHIIYWFKYCRKWVFPFSRVSLGNVEIDQFPELIIHLIARQLYDTLSSKPLSMYQHVEEGLLSPRGSINFKRYLSRSISGGNFHRIECDYEPFLYDNKVNRIIKYCARLLTRQTRFPENLRLLQEITFILSDVEDQPFTSRDIDNIVLNQMFSEYHDVLDSCRIVLSSHFYSSHAYDLNQWCVLFPMEYIFEDFLAGFLEINFGHTWKVEYQKSDMYISDEPRAFRMQHDIFLTAKDGSGRKIIVDAKYKLRVRSDVKQGISQGDLYQLLSYAIKRGCSEAILLYPNTEENQFPVDTFRIRKTVGNPEVNVTAANVPFWSSADFPDIEPSLRNELSAVLRSVRPEGSAADIGYRLDHSQ